MLHMWSNVHALYPERIDSSFSYLQDVVFMILKTINASYHSYLLLTGKSTQPVTLGEKEFGTDHQRRTTVASAQDRREHILISTGRAHFAVSGKTATS